RALFPGTVVTKGVRIERIERTLTEPAARLCAFAPPERPFPKRAPAFLGVRPQDASTRRPSVPFVFIRLQFVSFVSNVFQLPTEHDTSSRAEQPSVSRQRRLAR